MLSVGLTVVGAWRRHAVVGHVCDSLREAAHVVNLLRLGDDAEIGLDRLPPAGIFLLGFFVRD